MIQQKFGIYTRVVAEINKVLQIGDLRFKDIALINQDDISKIEEVDLEVVANGESEQSYRFPQ